MESFWDWEYMRGWLAPEKDEDSPCQTKVQPLETFRLNSPNKLNNVFLLTTLLVGVRWNFHLNPENSKTRNSKNSKLQTIWPYMAAALRKHSELSTNLYNVYASILTTPWTVPWAHLARIETHSFFHPPYMRQPIWSIIDQRLDILIRSWSYV